MIAVALLCAVTVGQIAIAMVTGRGRKGNDGFPDPQGIPEGRPKTLSKNTESYKKMEAAIINGDFDQNANPKDIWATDQLYYMWDLTRWRSTWNRLKAEHGVMARGAPAGGNPSVAGVACIGDARSMMGMAPAAAPLQGNQNPVLQVPGAPKKAGAASLKVPPAGLKSGDDFIMAQMPPLAQAVAQPVHSKEFSLEEVAESPMLEYKVPHLVAHVKDARARRDLVIAAMQCLTGSHTYTAEIRRDEMGDNTKLAIKVPHHYGLERSETVLKGLQGTLTNGQLILAGRVIDALIGDLKGGDSNKQVKWKMEIELPIAVSTTLIHQQIYNKDEMDFLVVIMEAQEANPMQQKKDCGSRVSIDGLPDLNFDI